MKIWDRLTKRIRRDGLRKPRTRRGVVYADPLHAGRHPFQTYMHVLCIMSGVPLMIAFFSDRWSATPNSITASLPGWLQFLWGLCLLLGSILAVTGSWWPGDYVNALTIERIGLVIAGGAALIFGVALVTVLGWPGAVSAALTVGFGLACIIRARDIGHIIQTAIKTLKAQTRAEATDVP